MNRLAAACIIAFVVALAGCSEVTPDNFARIEEGMTEQEVNSILGKPTESNSFNVLGVSSATSHWVGRDAVIAVQFLNGRAVLKIWENPTGT